MAVLGVELGAERVAAALFRADPSASAPDRLERRELAPGAGGRVLGRRLTALLRELAAGEGVEAVGVAVSGGVGTGGVVAVPGLAGWEAYPLLHELEAAFRHRLPVRLLPQPAAVLLGESWRGAAAGCRDAIYLQVDDAIAGAILVGGELLRGSGGLAGGIGWLALARPWLEAYRHVGCFQFHASGSGLAEVARLLLSATPRYQGPLRGVPPEALTAEHIFAALDARDAIAAEVLTDAIAYWGMAAANLVSLFNPQRILFGGALFGPALKLLARIRGEAERWAEPAAMRQVEFLPAALEEAALWGALRSALGQSAAPAAARAPDQA